jgi:hypothetical protein
MDVMLRHIVRFLAEWAFLIVAWCVIMILLWLSSGDRVLLLLPFGGTALLVLAAALTREP